MKRNKEAYKKDKAKIEFVSKYEYFLKIIQLINNSIANPIIYIPMFAYPFLHTVSFSSKTTQTSQTKHTENNILHKERAINVL